MRDSAVSPVIGVILMVAIAVVLSLGVLLTVQNTADDVGDQPTWLWIARTTATAL